MSVHCAIIGEGVLLFEPLDIGAGMPIEVSLVIDGGRALV